MENIKKTARHIADVKKDYEGMAVVVGSVEPAEEQLSVLTGRALGDISEDEVNALLETGVRQKAAMLAVALQDLGVDAKSMTGFRSGIVSNKYLANEEIREISTEEAEAIISEGKIAVVSGFQNVAGADAEADGSDITAVGIAAHLGCDCEIFTEKECMYTTDRDLYPEAKQIKALTYEELMEISGLSAHMIDTRAVELAKKYDVKVFLGKTLEQDKSKGTYIVNKEMIINENLMVEDMPITGMAIQDEVSIFTLRKVPADGKAVAECFRILGELGINVDMISQQMAQDGTCSVSFSCDAAQAEALVNELSKHAEFSDIEVDRKADLAMISLVGVGMATHSGVSGEVFRILAENSVRYYHITTSETSISVTVDVAEKLKAVIALCRAFHL